MGFPSEPKPAHAPPKSAYAPSRPTPRFLVTVAALTLAAMLLGSELVSPDFGSIPAVFDTAEAAYTAGDSRYFDIGSPTLTDLFVSPTGNDANAGTSSSQPLQTLTEAWNRLPATTTTTGYRINLLPGSYPCGADELASCVNYFADRAGTYRFPIILRAAGGPGTAIIRGGLNLANVQYLYLLDLNLVGGNPLPTNSAGNNLVHLERGDHVLLRGLVLAGPSCASDSPPCSNNLQEVLKVNQTQYLYVEDSTIGGAWHTSVDYFSVQYGHLQNNRIHTAGQWCMYFKGGSAYLRVEGNELSQCLLGFQAGQTSNFVVMRSPWLHYETYDVKFINNVLHDLPGVGMSVAGSYNLLLANNTLYRVGTDTGTGYALMQTVYGERLCDPLPPEIPASETLTICGSYITSGGWGTTTAGQSCECIPNRNVYVYNNIFYNPGISQTQYTHFIVRGPVTPSPQFRNISNPAASDVNLQIRGNVVWNGAADKPLGVEEGGAGCQPSNRTCNATQLRADNAINTVEPQLTNPASGDFRPIAGGNVFSLTTMTIPSFPGGDLPASPVVAQGTLTNTVSLDRDGTRRSAAGLPGAYTGSAFTATSKVFLPVVLNRS